MSSAPPILALRDARLAFGDKLLFEDLTLFLGRGDRAALVGANGTGKSTLLKCLGGLVDLDGGERFVQPGTTIAWVPQEVEVPDGQSLIEFVSRADGAKDGLRAENRRLHRTGRKRPWPKSASIQGSTAVVCRVARTVAPPWPGP